MRVARYDMEGNKRWGDGVVFFRARLTDHIFHFFCFCLESPHFNDEPASDLQITVESNSPHSENRAHDSQHPEENTINSPRVEKSAHFSPHSEKHVDDSEHPEKLPSELLNTDEIREVEFNSDSLTWGKWIEMNYK